MSVGFGLIRSVLSRTIPLSRLSEEGIAEVHFLPGDERSAYSFLREYSQEVGGLPSIETVALHLRDRTPLDNIVDEPFEFWIPRIKDRLRVIRMNNGLSSIRSEIESGRIQQAVTALSDLYMELRDSYGNRVVDSITIKRDALQHHNRIQSHEILPGVPTGFPYIDEVSGGMQPQDFITILGETGVGKTSLSLSFARSAHLDGRSVLYLSTEVGLLQIGRRLLAMDYRQNLNDIKLGRMSTFRSNFLAETLNAETHQEGFFEFLPGGIYASLNDVLLVAKERSPDLLVIDGAYLLRLTTKRGATPRWDILTSIVEELKNFAMVEHIPLLATYQFNRKAPGSLEGVAGTKAITDASSIVLSLEYERREDAVNPAEARYRILRFLKGREGESGSIRILFDFENTAILQDRVLSGGVLRQVLRENEPEMPQFGDSVAEI